jgi:hypothetical protein
MGEGIMKLVISIRGKPAYILGVMAGLIAQHGGDTPVSKIK